MIYLNLMKRSEAIFKDGEKVSVSKDDPSDFMEGLYRRDNMAAGLRYGTEGGRTIVYLPEGLRLIGLHNPSYSVNEILNEVFIDHVYGEPNLRDRIAVDIGAGIGDSALYFALMGASEVYAFEPNREFYEIASENVKMNKLDNRIHLFNEAVNGGNNQSSLDRVLRENSLDHIFLKIDCEGCEYDIVLNSDDNVFERIQDLSLEYHGNPKVIMSRLEKFGYHVRLRKGTKIICAAKVEDEPRFRNH
jgi:hypothetical protein